MTVLAIKGDERADSTFSPMASLADGLITGFAAPGATISVANLSEDINGSAKKVGVVADSGLFVVAVPASVADGDYLELTFTVGASESKIIVRSGDPERDTRTPTLTSLEDMRAELRGSTVEVLALYPSLRIAEPGVTLAVRNKRTGGATSARVDAGGRLSEPLRLAARAGDRIEVVAIDDAQQRTPAAETLLSMRPPASERLEVAPSERFTSHSGRALRQVRRFSAPLFLPGVPLYRQFAQGSKATDCFLVAALVATANVRPDYVRGLISQRRKDYVVRLFDLKGRPAPALVSNGLYVDGTGKPIYALGSLGAAFLEKAFARAPKYDTEPNALKDSYQVLDGGNAADALSRILGLPGETTEMRSEMQDWLWARLQKARAEGLPSCVGTRAEPQAEIEAQGLQAGHAYAVLDFAEVNGQRLVKLYEPHRKFEPMTGRIAADGEKDGEFWLPLAAVCQYFDYYYGVTPK